MNAENKLRLLKEYTEVQAYDNGLWFAATCITEDFVQRELRKTAWLIEEATEAEIEAEIKKYKLFGDL
jgi:hypothetical protein